MSPKKKAKSGTDLLLGVVVDRSGSMGHHVQSTCDGFNRLLEEQQAVEGSDAFLSLVTFNDHVQVPFVALDIHEVPPLGSLQNPYTPSGFTALYDAVVTMIQGIDAWLANHPKFGGKVLVSIFTDGLNNASSTPLTTMNAMVEARQAAGWEFAFLGTGGSAWTEGSNFVSVSADSNVPVMASAVGVRSSYTATSSVASSMRGAEGAAANVSFAAAYAGAMDDAEDDADPTG